MFYQFHDDLLQRSGDHFHQSMTCYADGESIGRMAYTIRYRDKKVVCSHIRGFHLSVDAAETAVHQLLQNLAQYVSPLITFYPTSFSKEVLGYLHQNTYPVLDETFVSLLTDIYKTRDLLRKKDLTQALEKILYEHIQDLSDALLEQDETILYRIAPPHLKAADRQRVQTSYEHFNHFSHLALCAKRVPKLDAIPEDQQCLCSKKRLTAFATPLRQSRDFLFDFQQRFLRPHAKETTEL